jgi:hypothetical protein
VKLQKASILGSIVLTFSVMAACAPAPEPRDTQASNTTSTATASRTSTIQPRPTKSPALNTDDAPSDDKLPCPPQGGQLLGEIDALESQVAQLRGRRPSAPVEITVLSDSQARERVTAAFVQQYSLNDAENNQLLYNLLGLLDDEDDLMGLYKDLLLEQVAGYFDFAENEMVLICSDEFGGVQRMTYVHEYSYALLHQAFDLERFQELEDVLCAETYDRCLALRALVDGDAARIQEQWMRTYASEEDYKEVLAFFSSFDMPVYESAPEFIQEELIFPSTYGLGFISKFYLKDGWAAVDSVYEDPPVSSEQILHPERYPKDRPVSIEIPDISEILADEWREVDRGSLGEWRTLAVLQQQLPRDIADVAAEGWGGDTYLLLMNEKSENSALILLTLWDTMRDAHEFTAGFIEFGIQQYGMPTVKSVSEATWELDDQAVGFVRVSNQTLWVVAPDSASLELLMEWVPFPARWSK